MRQVAALFGYLFLTASRNRWRRRLARLRRPRYALALVVGAAYVWWFFLRPSGTGVLSPLVGPDTAGLYALMLAGSAATWWLSPNEKNALAFSPAEIHFLFPAPVTRRALVFWKLLSAQTVILVGTLLWVAILRGGGAQAAWLRALSLWIVFSTIHLHRLGAQLVHAGAKEHGAPGWRRLLPALAVVVAAAAAVLWSLWRARAAFVGVPDFAEGVARLTRALHAPAARVVLWPVQVTTAPLFARTTGAWLRALGPALLMLGAHWVWVLRTDAAFEEAAVAASAARADRVAAVRERRRAPGAGAARRGRFVSRLLAARGAAPVAVAWKNVLAFTRLSRPTTLLVGMVVGLLAASLVVGRGDAGELVVPLVLTVAVLLVLFGPGFVRHDLRNDLAHLELLRGWPLSGFTIVLAEIAGATVLLTMLQAGYLGLLLLAAPTLGIGVPGARQLALWVPMLALWLPAFNALHFAVYNTGAVLFPDWVRSDRERIGGIEATGQGMIVFVFALVTVLLLLALGAAAGLVVVAAIGTATGGAVPGLRPASWLVASSPAAWLAAVAAMAMVLLGETALLAKLAGRALDRMEPEDAR